MTLPLLDLTAQEERRRRSVRRNRSFGLTIGGAFKRNHHVIGRERRFVQFCRTFNTQCRRQTGPFANLRAGDINDKDALPYMISRISIW